LVNCLFWGQEMRYSVALITLLISSAAVAAPFSFSFNGTVTGTPDQGAVRFPDTGAGVATPWSSPALPSYPVAIGDSLNVVFSGSLPDFSNPALQKDSQFSSFYRLNVTGPAIGSGGGAPDPLAYIINSVVVGTLGGFSDSVQSPSVGGFNLLYDPSTGASSIDFGADGSFGMGGLKLPAYKLSADGTTVTTNGSTYNPITESGAVASATQNSMSFGVFGSALIAQEGTANPAGRQGSLTLSGTYSIPQSSSSTSTSSGGDPGGIDVPDPDMLTLFGMGAAGLMWRRRRAKPAAG
jgi:PEP-CTERM motif